jgi:hypothetical protein
MMGATVAVVSHVEQGHEMAALSEVDQSSNYLQHSGTINNW